MENIEERIVKGVKQCCLIEATTNTCQSCPYYEYEDCCTQLHLDMLRYLVSKGVLTYEEYHKTNMQVKRFTKAKET